MRVRTKQHHDGTWQIQVWCWYWPIWKTISYDWHNYEGARLTAERAKHPPITEIV